MIGSCGDGRIGGGQRRGGKLALELCDTAVTKPCHVHALATVHAQQWLKALVNVNELLPDAPSVKTVRERCMKQESGLQM